MDWGDLEVPPPSSDMHVSKSQAADISLMRLEYYSSGSDSQKSILVYYTYKTCHQQPFIEIDETSGKAEMRSYYTVLQVTHELPLQPNRSGPLPR